MGIFTDDFERDLANSQQALDLVTRSLKLQKAGWEVERKEMLSENRRLRDEIQWLRARSIKHVLGLWIWEKISYRKRLAEIKSYWL